MLFQRYYFKGRPNTGGKPTMYWYMILQSVQDVLDYCEIDADKLTRAWLRLPQAKKYSHLNTREWVIDKAIQMAVLGAEEGEKILPPVVVDEFISKKSQGMLEIFLKYGNLRVNMVGGYCPLDSFIDTWDCKMIEEVEKDGLGFPADDVEPFDTDVVVLENDKSANWFVKELKERYIENGKDLNIHVINHLRERDKSYLWAMLTRSKAVAISSMLIDEAQIMKFIKLFETVKPMTIYLRVYDRGEKQLREIPEFNSILEKHDVKFIG